MTVQGLALFETALGPCAIAWGQAGIVGTALPEPSAAGTRRRMLGRFPDAVEAAPPAFVAAAIEGVVALLAGEAITFSAAGLDWRAIGDFERKVYEAALTIRPGKTLTYGAMAADLGDPRQARAVGQALGRNPWPIIVPCHRITAASGKTGGFSAPGGVSTKLRLLAIEDAHAEAALPLFASGR